MSKHCVDCKHSKFRGTFSADEKEPHNWYCIRQDTELSLVTGKEIRVTSMESERPCVTQRALTKTPYGCTAEGIYFEPKVTHKSGGLPRPDLGYYSVNPANNVTTKYDMAGFEAVMTEKVRKIVKEEIAKCKNAS